MSAKCRKAPELSGHPVQLSSTPSNQDPYHTADLGDTQAKPAHLPDSRERARETMPSDVTNAEPVGGSLRDNTLNWEWEPDTIVKRTYGALPDADNAADLHRTCGPESDAESSGPSGPASVRSIPETERASVSLSSSDGLHRSTEVSLNYSSESDQEESAPTAASVPPDCSRRYPARSRHPPDRWSPPP